MRAAQETEEFVQLENNYVGNEAEEEIEDYKLVQQELPEDNEGTDENEESFALTNSVVTGSQFKSNVLGQSRLPDQLTKSALQPRKVDHSKLLQVIMRLRMNHLDVRRCFEVWAKRVTERKVVVL